MISRTTPAAGLVAARQPQNPVVETRSRLIWITRAVAGLRAGWAAWQGLKELNHHARPDAKVLRAQILDRHYGIGRRVKDRRV